MTLQKNEIIKSDLKPLAVVNSQIRISNNLLAEYDIFNELLNPSNITEAINLAVSSRKITDPFFDKNELKSISSKDLTPQVLEKVYSNNFEQHSLYKISIPKNRIEDREFEYVDLTSYSIRYLIALVLFRRIRISDSVFGGKDEIFIVRNSEEDPYQKNNEDFWSWQKGVIISGEFKWVYIADIRKYYDNISTKVLLRVLTQEFGITSDRFLSAFGQCFEKLTIGSMCDHFIQNICLAPLDKKLTQKGDIKFSRLTDDIRIFCKTESDAAGVHQLVSETISDLGLSLNEDKQFIIQPIRYIEPNKPYDLDYHQYAYDEAQKEKFSHYIEISDIDKFDVENILNLTFGTYDSFTWCNPKYDFKQLPWKITLNQILDGDTGFKLGSIDINYFIATLENSDNREVSFQDLEELGKVIYYSYGNYRFYFRLIKLYFNLLTRISDAELLTKGWGKLMHYLPSNRYKRYVFWRVLFSKMGEDEKSFYDYFENQISTSIIDQICKVFCDESIHSYLISEIHYFIKNKYLDKVKCFTGETFWKSEKFWEERYNKLAKDELTSQYDRLDFIRNLVQILPDSFLLKKIYAEVLFESKEYQKAYEILNFLHKRNQDISLFVLAFCCSEIGLINDSMNFYTQYLEREKYAGAYNNRAILFKEMNNFKDALSDYSAAISLEPEELYFSNRGSLYYEMHNFEVALKDFESAYDLNKENKFLYKQTECLLKLGKVDEAKTTYYKFYYGLSDRSGMKSFEKCWEQMVQKS